MAILIAFLMQKTFKRRPKLSITLLIFATLTLLIPYIDNTVFADLHVLLGYGCFVLWNVIVYDERNSDPLAYDLYRSCVIMSVCFVGKYLSVNGYSECAFLLGIVAYIVKKNTP